MTSPDIKPGSRWREKESGRIVLVSRLTPASATYLWCDGDGRPTGPEQRTTFKRWPRRFVWLRDYPSRFEPLEPSE